MQLDNNLLILYIVSIFSLLFGQHEASTAKKARSHHDLQHFHEQQKQLEIQHVIRESYGKVSAQIVANFNEKCKLALQNCLFRTEWEKVFGHERLFEYQKLKGEKRSTTSAQELANASSYFYCQPFLIGKFCIDDYLKRAGDENFLCVNGSSGNSPEQFKRDVWRDECKFYYDFFFNNSSSPKTCLSALITNIFMTFVVLYFYHF
jgi:hypothetical protein